MIGKFMEPYSVLGLQRGATEEEAKAAFRKLAKTCHPDLHPNNPDAEKRFKEINEAYDRIKTGNIAETIQFRTGDFHYRFEDIFFDDIIGQMRGRQRNMDTHLECRLTLEEAFHGKEFTVSIQSGRATKNVKVVMPPGMITGMRITVPQGGTQTNMSVPPGCLHVIARIAPHDRFVRDGHHLVTMVPVSFFDVMLGKEIEVTSIDSKPLNVTIPVGFDPLKRLRLAGQGMPDPFTNVRGDLLVGLSVQYPSLTEAQLALIRQAAELTEGAV